MKLTLRDLFWLALLVAGLTVWFSDQWRAMELERHPRHFHEIFARASNECLRRQAALEAFAQMTDEELNEYFASLPPNKLYQVGERHYERCVEYEPCVAEMARRGLVDKLQENYDALMAQSPGSSSFDFPDNLELLTALRRAEGNRDPVTIHIALNGSPRVMSKFRDPKLTATIENVDVALEAVKLKQGGDYRGGRLGRWRFVLTDDRGRNVADSGDLWSDGDGLSQTFPLPYGARSRWNYDFDLRSFLSPPASGKYQLQALYHNSLCIAHERDITGLIVVKSKPISVVVNNREPASVKRHWSRFPAPLGILAICLLLTLVSIVRRDRPAMEPESANAFNVVYLPGISRRDFRWGLLITAVAVGMWLSDGRHDLWGEAWYQRPDAAANWSIRLDDDVKP